MDKNAEARETPFLDAYCEHGSRAPRLTRYVVIGLKYAVAYNLVRAFIWIP